MNNEQDSVSDEIFMRSDDVTLIGGSFKWKSWPSKEVIWENSGKKDFKWESVSIELIANCFNLTWLK